jgi:uncharacterized cofD-like protein
VTASVPAPGLQARSGPAVVALGGGHGLAASLSALRHVTASLTAVVTVADDGGSSGRLRREMGVLPPGDLRMALAALCGDDDWGRTWAQVVQHRFRAEGDLYDHSVGNLLIAALWDLLDDPVAGLDLVGRLLRAEGRVLPMSTTPLEIVAQVVGPDVGSDAPLAEVRGQGAVATTRARVVAVGLEPPAPEACPEAVAAVREADWVVLGPGSWFTSVIPHLLVPDLARALVETEARKVIVLNLAPQPGETAGFTPENHLEVLAVHVPDLRVDVVLADSASVPDPESLRQVAADLGAELVLEQVGVDDGSAHHDVDRLASAYAEVFTRGRIGAWR